MNYKIIDNALPQEEFKLIRDTIFSNSFPWNLSTEVSDNREVLPIHASYYFTHLFWNGFIAEPASEMFAPLLNLMECKALIRIKANLYPSTSELIEHENHHDYDFSHKAAIFSLNTNDGFTILKEDNVKVESVENRLLLFDASKAHRSTTCTNKKCRINVNFNYF